MITKELFIELNPFLKIKNLASTGGKPNSSFAPKKFSLMEKLKPEIEGNDMLEIK